MPSVFTRIFSGELPGRIVWSDDRVVAMLTIRPITDGHTLVIPRAEVDQWIDLDPATAAHVAWVSQHVGAALRQEFQTPRVGVMVAGFEVHHCHYHLVPAHDIADLDFGRQDPYPDPRKLDTVASRLRNALRSAGQGAFVPPEPT